MLANSQNRAHAHGEPNAASIALFGNYMAGASLPPTTALARHFAHPGGEDGTTAERIRSPGRRACRTGQYAQADALRQTPESPGMTSQWAVDEEGKERHYRQQRRCGADRCANADVVGHPPGRSEEHTSELQSLV